MRPHVAAATGRKQLPTAGWLCPGFLYSFTTRKAACVLHLHENQKTVSLPPLLRFKGAGTRTADRPGAAPTAAF